MTIEYQQSDTSDDEYVAMGSRQSVSESLDADIRTILNDGGHAEVVEDESTDDTGPLTVIGGMLAAQSSIALPAPKVREILGPSNAARTDWNAVFGEIFSMPRKVS